MMVAVGAASSQEKRPPGSLRPAFEAEEQEREPVVSWPVAGCGGLLVCDLLRTVYRLGMKTRAMRETPREMMTPWMMRKAL
jgi:hypothetical protein